jgi:long-subunit acyl-CoA synthetase (AMP-forming)
MSGIHFVTEPDAYLEPKIGEGHAALPPITVNQRFRNTVAKFGDKGAMYLKRPVNGVVPSEWKVWSWKEYFGDCRAFAKTLIHLDVKTFSIINILGFNSPEWLIANCGSIMAGELIDRYSRVIRFNSVS